MNKISEAREHAKQLLKKLELKPNFDIKKVAQFFNIEVQEKHFNKEVSGLIKRESRESGNPIIVVNVDDGEARKRFTIAHEIGHFLLHSSSLLVDTDQSFVNFRDEKSSTALDLKEIQANQFAAELLMPTDEVLNDLKIIVANKETKDNLSLYIPKLADKYGVSSTAMTFKIGSLLV